MVEMKHIHDVIDEFDNQTLLRTMRSKMFQQAYEEFLVEAGSLNEVERYCMLHAKVAIINDGKLLRFEDLDLPKNWWRRDV